MGNTRQLGFLKKNDVRVCSKEFREDIATFDRVTQTMDIPADNRKSSINHRNGEHHQPTDRAHNHTALSGLH
jgi:hypothetical protein